ncbi:hypothetical protein RI367_003909 [Sorochytrium milnesiophthora]
MLSTNAGEARADSVQVLKKTSGGAYARLLRIIPGSWPLSAAQYDHVKPDDVVAVHVYPLSSSVMFKAGEILNHDLLLVSACEEPWSLFLPAMAIGSCAELEFGGELIPSELQTPDESAHRETLHVLVRPMAIASPASESMKQLLERVTYYKVVANAQFKATSTHNALFLYRAIELMCSTRVQQGFAVSDEEMANAVADEDRLRNTYHAVLGNICMCYIKLSQPSKALEYCTWIEELEDVDGVLLAKTAYRRAQALAMMDDVKGALAVVALAVRTASGEQQRRDLQALAVEIVDGKVRAHLKRGEFHPALSLLQATSSIYPALRPLHERARQEQGRAQQVFRSKLAPDARQAKADEQKELLADLDLLNVGLEDNNDWDARPAGVSEEDWQEQQRKEQEEWDKVRQEVLAGQTKKPREPRLTLDDLPPLDECIQALVVDDVRAEMHKAFSILTPYDYSSFMQWLRVNYCRFRPYLNADRGIFQELLTRFVRWLVKHRIMALHEGTDSGCVSLGLTNEMSPWDIINRKIKFTILPDPKHTKMSAELIDQLFPLELDNAELARYLRKLSLRTYHSGLQSMYHPHQAYTLQKVTNWTINQMRCAEDVLWLESTPTQRKITVANAYMRRLAMIGAVHVFEPRGNERRRVWIKPRPDDDAAFDAVSV